jgi:O-antigen/teichoic acid export membrane protein
LAALEQHVDNLKQKALRSGFVKLVGQGLNLILRFIFLFVFARLLNPSDFGLIGMVTAVTGVYQLFTSAGLSTATIQSANVTDHQLSALFWINVLVGVALTLLCMATAPFVVTFYHEPRLFWVTMAMSIGFLFTSLGVQHNALLQRQMRYPAIVAIEIVSQIMGSGIGVAMAASGYGYWSLVATAIVPSAFSTVGTWVVARWIPGRPNWPSGIGSMLWFGGTVTLNGLVAYIAYNLDKILLGRVWGANAVGIYGRAYFLIEVPTSSLNFALGSVTFSTLSRLQGDPERLKSYFLKSYSVLVSITLPITLFCAIFSSEIISVALGPKWAEAAIIFRLLAPTIAVFGMINPLYWFLLAVGLQRRSLNIAFFIAPWVTAFYLVGLPYGPRGIAAAFSAAMILFLIPCLIWCLHGTIISMRDLLKAISRPLLSSIASGICGIILLHLVENWLQPLTTLLLGGAVTAISYAIFLLFILGQKNFYHDLLKSLLGGSATQTPIAPGAFGPND